MGSVEVGVEQPVLVGSGGVEAADRGVGDGFVRWVGLMEVVEGLCPVWPERGVVESRTFLI